MCTFTFSSGFAFAYSACAFSAVSASIAWSCCPRAPLSSAVMMKYLN
jgi:hypothetical protein